MSVPDQVSGNRLRGFTEFLVQHHACAAGFDVSHPDGAGNGRLVIACRGCGGSFDYVTARIEDEGFAAAFGQAEVPAVGLEPGAEAFPATAAGAAAAAPPSMPPAPPSAPAPPQAAPPPPAPTATLPPPLPGPPPAAPVADAGPPPVAPGPLGDAPVAAEAPDALVEPASDWRELRRSPVVTVLLGVLAVVAATVAVIRIAASDEGGGPQTSPRAPGALATPGAPPPAAPAAAPGREVTLRTQAYSVAMPDSWHRRTRGGALSLSAPGGDVEVRIFFQRRPDLSVDEMVGEASSFLAGEHPGATVTAEGSRRTAGGSGPQLVAAYPGGSERALVLARGDVRYLILRRVDGGAAASLQRQSVAVQRSFNPR